MTDLWMQVDDGELIPVNGFEVSERHGFTEPVTGPPSFVRWFYVAVEGRGIDPRRLPEPRYEPYRLRLFDGPSMAHDLEGVRCDKVELGGGWRVIFSKEIWA